MARNQARRLVSLALVAGILLTVLLVAAEAKEKRYKPLRFRGVSNDQDQVQTPVSIGALPTALGEATFLAPVRLPVGTVFEGVSFFSTQTASNPFVALMAFSPGFYRRAIYRGGTSGPSPDMATPSFTSCQWETGVDPVVQPGYLYYLQVTTPPNTFVWEVDVSYRLP